MTSATVTSKRKTTIPARIREAVKVNAVDCREVKNDSMTLVQ